MNSFEHLLQQWREQLAGNPKPVGLPKADFLERYQQHLSQEDLAKLNQLPDTTVFYPTSVDVDETASTETLLTCTCTFQFDKTLG